MAMKRPKIYTENLRIPVTKDMLARLDREAKRRQSDRCETVRSLLREALDLLDRLASVAPPKDTD
jgi:metal-responsive CopG/Arc/MetJ family transcriptional regulator